MTFPDERRKRHKERPQTNSEKKKHFPSSKYVFFKNRLGVERESEKERRGVRYFHKVVRPISRRRNSYKSWYYIFIVLRLRRRKYHAKIEKMGDSNTRTRFAHIQDANISIDVTRLP